MINELSALRRIEEQFHKASKGVQLGIGDDCAAVKFDTDKLVLATTDSQVEDVHFVKSLITPEQLARKAVAVSVSDVGAMGGVPRFILASVGLSLNEDEEFLDGLTSGFKSSEEEFRIKLVGGNLSSSNKLFIDITVLGEVEPHLMVKRSGASPGDIIYASGTLGDSSLGLKILQDNKMGDKYEFLINRHLRPLPRLALGRELAQKQVPTSMIDVSDGILLDLERITSQQGVGARVELVKLPTSKHYEECIHQYSDDKYAPALSGGEDYELLFTSHEDRRGDVEQISKNLNIQITEIGYVTKDRAVEIINLSGEIYPITNRGFVHFSN